MTMNFGRLVTYLKRLQSIKLHSSWVRWSFEITQKFKKYYTSTTTRSMCTKFGRMITYNKGLPPINLCDPFISWSCKIMWQIKTIISPLPQRLWLPKFVRWWLTLSNSHPYSLTTLYSRGLARSRGKLNPLFLHYHYSHQTCQVGTWGVPIIY